MPRTPWTESGVTWLHNEVARLARTQQQNITARMSSGRRSASSARLIERSQEHEQQAVSESRLNSLRTLANSVRPEKMVPLSGAAAFGQMVTVSIRSDKDFQPYERTFVLGGVDESIVQLPYEVISCTSPVGRAVRNREVGEEVDCEVENRLLRITILEITAPPLVNQTLEEVV